MPRALSIAARARIKADLAAGIDIKTITATHAVSDKKARAMKKLYDNCGEVWLPSQKVARTGRPPKITSQHEERLRLYLADHPDAYIKEMCRFLEGDCGMVVDESTMWRAVNRMGLLAQRVPKSKEERGFWVQTLSRDESSNAVSGAQKKKKQRRESVQHLSRAMIRNLLAKTHDFVKNYMSQARFDVSHDYSHVQRVLALSMQIQHVEQQKYSHVKFDPTITELVALMHDVDDHKYQQPPPPPPTQQQQQQHQNSTSLPSPPSTSTDPHYPPHQPSPTIESHLLSLGWPPHIAIPVSIISASISFTTETQHPGIHASALRRFPELAVVQDADRLDALGAIGVARACMFSGARGRGLDDTVKHFEDKLVRLESMMKTGEGRRLARERGERVECFRGWLREEMGFSDGATALTGTVTVTEGEDDMRNVDMGEEGGDSRGRMLVDDNDDVAVGLGEGDTTSEDSGGDTD